MKNFNDYWWVSHNQTYESEIKGYMWSPKRNKNGARNVFYDNMVRAQIGDAVFSFASSEIKAIGVIDSKAVTRDRPREFSDQWDINGWYVGVNWVLLNQPFRPSKFIEVLRPLLPSKYSPIREDGNGNQGVYLAHLNKAFGSELLRISLELNPSLVVDLDEIS